jgi:hypothetical protein
VIPRLSSEMKGINVSFSRVRKFLCIFSNVSNASRNVAVTRDDVLWWGQDARLHMLVFARGLE